MFSLKSMHAHYMLLLLNVCSIKSPGGGGVGGGGGLFRINILVEFSLHFSKLYYYTNN